MSFDLDNSYLDIEVDDTVLGWYETEGVRKTLIPCHEIPRDTAVNLIINSV